MVLVDTSAWIEYFRDGKQAVVEEVDRCLEEESVIMGDLVYCEVMQGIKSPRQRSDVARLLDALPRRDMVGFEIAAKSASNYRLLRSKGITVRKTMDVLIGTFCAENGVRLVHSDRDFAMMSMHIGLELSG